MQRTVRATVTMRVAPRETTKLLGTRFEWLRPTLRVAILPAATDELHRNGYVPYSGDKAAGLEKSSRKQNPAYESPIIESKKRE